MRDAVAEALARRPLRWFVTGGAGFIGSHVVDLLVSAGHQVTVYDNLSLSTDRYIAQYARQGKITFHNRDVTELDPLVAAMAGHDIVFHLAANTDIPSGFTKHRIDLDNDVVATWAVLEAMVKNGVKDILFSSTGAPRPAVALRRGEDRVGGVHRRLLQSLRRARLDLPLRQRDRRAHQPRRDL
jgi:UDP-glucose 4-epimerase